MFVDSILQRKYQLMKQDMRFSTNEKVAKQQLTHGNSTVTTMIYIINHANQTGKICCENMEISRDCNVEFTLTK